MTLSTTRGRQKDEPGWEIHKYAKKREGKEGRRKEGIKAIGAQVGGERSYECMLRKSPPPRRKGGAHCFYLFMNLFNFKADFA